MSGVESKHVAGPARRDGVRRRRRRRRCLVADDGFERADLTDRHAERSVLGHIEHVKGLRELERGDGDGVRLDHGDVQLDAGVVTSGVAGADAEGMTGRRGRVQTAGYLQRACSNQHATKSDSSSAIKSENKACESSYIRPCS